MKIKFLVATIGAFIAFSSLADSVAIQVNGKVVASPCIANGGVSSLTVDLTNIQATTLATAGSSSTPVAFNIGFTGCPAGTSSVTVTFTGTSDTVAGANYYKNAGTAPNVAVALIDTSTGNLKGTGTTVTQNVQADHTITIAMQAKAYSSAGGATPGTISSAITATMQYN